MHVEDTHYILYLCSQPAYASVRCSTEELVDNPMYGEVMLSGDHGHYVVDPSPEWSHSSSDNIYTLADT